MQAWINGIEITTEQPLTILKAAENLGIEIPTLCFLEEGRTQKSCRLCLVEIQGKKRLFPACSTILQEGDRVETESERVIESRRSTLELLLSEHDWQCGTCEVDGFCRFQRYCQKYDVTESLFGGGSPGYPLDESHERIAFDPNRCVRCYRCVNICEAMNGVSAIELTAGKGGIILSSRYGIQLKDADCTGCGLCVISCPTGALTDHMRLNPERCRQITGRCRKCEERCELVLFQEEQAPDRREIRPPQVPAQTLYFCHRARYGEWEELTAGDEKECSKTYAADMDDVFASNRLFLLFFYEGTEISPGLELRIRRAVREGKQLLLFRIRGEHPHGDYEEAQCHRLWESLGNLAVYTVDIKAHQELLVLNGIMNQIFAEHLEDREFLSRQIIGEEELRECLADYPLSLVASETGVEQSFLRRVVRLCAGSKETIFFYPYSRTGEPEQKAIMYNLSNLALITGQEPHRRFFTKWNGDRMDTYEKVITDMALQGIEWLPEKWATPKKPDPDSLLFFTRRPLYHSGPEGQRIHNAFLRESPGSYIELHPYDGEKRGLYPGTMGEAVVDGEIFRGMIFWNIAVFPGTVWVPRVFWKQEELPDSLRLRKKILEKHGYDQRYGNLHACD